jgi:gamma-glutamyltranspeptidase/glutathione hydrolase
MRPRALSRRSAFVNAPVNVLITRIRRAARVTIDLERATPAADVLAASPREGSNTTHYSVIDSGGQQYHTLNFPYGVGLVAEGTGAAQQQLDDFTAAPGASGLWPGRVRSQSARP